LVVVEDDKKDLPFAAKASYASCSSAFSFFVLLSKKQREDEERKVCFHFNSCCFCSLCAVIIMLVGMKIPLSLT